MLLSCGFGLLYGYRAAQGARSPCRETAAKTGRSNRETDTAIDLDTIKSGAKLVSELKSDNFHAFTYLHYQPLPPSLLTPGRLAVR